MNPFEIFIAYVSWGNGGKKRPVLVLQMTDNNISVYTITTQYANKSEAVRAKFFKINDWKLSCLDKQSYIDTGTRFKLKLSALNNQKPIGKLTKSDKQKFIEFLKP